MAPAPITKGWTTRGETEYRVAEPWALLGCIVSNADVDAIYLQSPETDARGAVKEVRCPCRSGSANSGVPQGGRLVVMTRIICGNCGAEVWWSLPRPDDPCKECGHPIGRPKGDPPQEDAVDEPTFREGRYLLQQDIERLENVVVPEDLLGLTG